MDNNQLEHYDIHVKKICALDVQISPFYILIKYFLYQDIYLYELQDVLTVY